MNVLIFCALIWAVCKLIGTASRRAREHAARREMERLRAEQARQREAIKQREREAREQARKQIEHDKAIAKAAKEREVMRKEQERQAAAIAKHEAEIENMRFKVERATADIDFLHQRIAELDAQLDYYLLQQAGTLPGSKSFEKYQSKIVSLHNQIYAAETKLNKAQRTKAQAEKELA